MTFTELGVSDSLISALAKLGITEPTDIQVAAIPVVREGRDAALHAETGTGKTLAYLLPLLARIDLKLEATQVIVLAPTHELALQIQRVACDVAQRAALPLRVLLLIGGTSLDRQIDKLKKKPHVVVGSAGRILDLIGQGRLKPQKVRALVVDESDRLLAGESLEVVQKIIDVAPRGRQLVFVSATEQPESARVMATLSPTLTIVRTAATPVNANIEHYYVVCEERDKPDLLRKLLHAAKPERALVFVHRNDTAEVVASKLAHHQVPVADLHGAFEKSARKQAMDDFRSARARVLIASDVAARGLDIAGVTHIFNLDAPSQSKAYLHRVGRTARAGAKGVAISLLTEQEVRLIRRYESELDITLTPILVREGKILNESTGKIIGVES
jgi:superfamily II DNA/RNA helicase